MIDLVLSLIGLGFLCTSLLLGSIREDARLLLGLVWSCFFAMCRGLLLCGGDRWSFNGWGSRGGLLRILALIAVVTATFAIDYKPFYFRLFLIHILLKRSDLYACLIFFIMFDIFYYKINYKIIFDIRKFDWKNT